MSITIKFDPPFQGMTELSFQDGVQSPVVAPGGFHILAPSPSGASRATAISEALGTAAKVVEALKPQPKVRTESPGLNGGTFPSFFVSNPMRADSVEKLMTFYRDAKGDVETPAPQDVGVPVKAPKAPAKRKAKKATATPAEIRAWADENGWTVGARGRIPAVVREAYEGR